MGTQAQPWHGSVDYRAYAEVLADMNKTGVLSDGELSRRMEEADTYFECKYCQRFDELEALLLKTQGGR